MKLRTLVKIAITSSVVLLCTGFALYSFFRLSSTGNQKDTNLYTLVPTSAIAVFATDDVAEFITKVDELTCSKKQQYLHVSKLFSYLKQFFYTISEDAPHGISRQMNQILISFHEPDNDRNQVLYCNLGEGDRELIDKFVQKYASSGYPPKTFDYKGKNITIYPMGDDDFLACYLTSDFFAISYQKKLIEEVIDARRTESSLATDPAFAGIRIPQKHTVVASIYVRLDEMIGWTEFDMKLKDDFIYFSGASRDIDTCFAFINVLRRQEPVKGFLGESLPSTAFYFSRQGLTDWSSLLSSSVREGDAKGDRADVEVAENDKRLARYLAENTRGDLVSCLFQQADTLLPAVAVMSLSVANVAESEKKLRSFVAAADGSHVSRKTPITFCYTAHKAHLIYTLPDVTLFAQLTQFADSTRQIHAVFYGERLLLSPKADGLSDYIHRLEAGDVLDDAVAYKSGISGLSASYHFMVMADFEQIFRQPENYFRQLPDFFFRNSEFFRHFVLFAQVNCANGATYPNLVFRYKTKRK